MWHKVRKKTRCTFFGCRVEARVLRPATFSFSGLEGFWGQPEGPNFPSPRATMLALHLDCSTAALTTPQKVLPIWRLVELKMLDFSDRTRTGVSILTSTADCHIIVRANLVNHPNALTVGSGIGVKLLGINLYFPPNSEQQNMFQN